MTRLNEPQFNMQLQNKLMAALGLGLGRDDLWLIPLRERDWLRSSGVDCGSCAGNYVCARVVSITIDDATL